MSVAVKTIPNRSATDAIGSWSGRETYQNFFRAVAPPIAEASSTSFGIEAIPARKITVANGRIRHACTVMIEAIAFRGVPSQFGGLEPIRCSSRRIQLKMLKVGSKNQRKPIVVSATGAAHGRRMKKRRIHLPRKLLISACARRAAPTITISCGMTVDRD